MAICVVLTLAAVGLGGNAAAEVTAPSPGKAWKALDQQAKKLFVLGWTAGYVAGFGADPAVRVTESNDQLHEERIARFKRWQEKPAAWIEGMDTFYADFRHWDRDWDLAMLYVLGLLQGSTKTQMESWLHETVMTPPSEGGPQP